MTILTGAALVFAINVATSLIKRWVWPRWGAFGVQVVAFVLAGVGAFYVLYGGNYPGLQDLVLAAGGVFSLAVAFYEVVLQHLSVFKEGVSLGSESDEG